jgi:uridine kinase
MVNILPARKSSHVRCQAKSGQTRVPINGAYPTICIDGRGASGKTTLADFLGANLDGFTVVHGDDYFEPHDDPITWGDFNEPRFDTDVLSPVRAGDHDIALRPFDFPSGHIGAEQLLTIREGVLVERWFGMSLNVLWDITIWVHTPAEICLERGLRRPGAVALGERARLAWETVWQPREERYIQATAPVGAADYVADGTVPFDDQFIFDTRL